MIAQNNYEVIGNQIRFIFQGDPSYRWNRVPRTEFRNLEEIEKWCSHHDSVVAQVNCVIDGLNQNAMSSTEVTDFLYRFASSYVGTVGNGITGEASRVESAELMQRVASQLSQDVSSIVHQVVQMALDCIMFLGTFWSVFF